MSFDKIKIYDFRPSPDRDALKLYDILPLELVPKFKTLVFDFDNEQ